MTGDFVVYLIHLSAPVGRARHYTGITRRDRLIARLREHGHGRGASLTAKAVERGIPMFLASSVSVNHPSEEKLIKRRGHAKSRCLICRNGFDGTDLSGRFYQLPVLPRGSFRPVSW
jgi:predicted GIY-YIG superfamily endonuclease